MSAVTATTTSLTVGGARPTLVTRALLLRCVTIFGASTSYYLLLSVAPLYVHRSGDGGDPGLVTGAFMAATVLGELSTPRLLTGRGHRSLLAAALILLGAPTLLLIVSSNEAVIVVACALRGLGFATTLVVGGALTASLIPPERRGEGLALVGVVSGAPALVLLPLSVWIATHVGYSPVFFAAAVVALVAVAAVPGLPRRALASGQAVGLARGFRTAALARPVIVFASTAMAAGIIVTFVPLAVSSASTELISVALFAQPAASAAARWVAGRHADRHGANRLVLVGLLASATGLLIAAQTHSPVAVVAGVAVSGVGFGLAQNATLTLMYERVPASAYATASAMWNFAYDAGMGIGAAGFGLLADQTGYTLAFALAAAFMLTALVPAWRDQVGLRRPGDRSR